jgi:cytochrome bd-type quinol oxidase subunit 2
MIKKTLLLVLLSIMHIIVYAQNNSNVEMADTMRSNGKIYVVIAVILTIFAGIIFYLVRLDRKISKIEKNHS